MKTTLVLVTLLLLVSCGKSSSGGGGGPKSSADANTFATTGGQQAQTLLSNLAASGVEFFDDGDKVTIECKDNYSITNAQRIASLQNLKSLVTQNPQGMVQFKTAKLYPYQAEALILSAMNNLQYGPGYYSNYCPANIIAEFNY